MDTAAGAAENQYFSDFAAALRYWRGKRGVSQLRLSADSGISQRHLSFLETGRAAPSRELILKLGIVLDIPLRQRNAMLLAAGFAPAYRERSLLDPELAAVMQALDFMLAQQAPYPALVVDRLWNLVMANGPAAGMMRWFLGMPAHAPIPRDGSVNVLKLILDPDGLRRCLVNWEEVCADLLHWVQREAMGDGPGSEATRLLDELMALPGIPAQPRPPRPALPAGPAAQGCGHAEPVHDDYHAGHAARRHRARAAAGILLPGRCRQQGVVRGAGGGLSS